MKRLGEIWAEETGFGGSGLEQKEQEGAIVGGLGSRTMYHGRTAIYPVRKPLNSIYIHVHVDGIIF